ncbi:MAG TPA: hypothetical protein VMS88_04565 [Terriglobales bacterium]|nr:hypothetical protein [Terriglobales bacterium]
MRSPVRFAPVLAVACVLYAVVVAPRARGLPLYAGRTGLMCASCHFDPNGGGPRNEFGFAFAKNRHALAPDTGGAWKDLDLTNRVGDRMPVYLGLNQRFMLLTTRGITSRNIDDFAFFNMENGLHVAFQPHRRLTLVYTLDAFSNLSGVAAGSGGPFRSKEAFGMIGGFPGDAYIKVGRIRTPFGLRMDDHTVATRNAFIDASGGPAFMPYDVRESDMGFELGADKGGFFGRAAFTNGHAAEFGSDPYAEAKTVKLGYNHPWFQSAVSLYDDFDKFGSDPFQRTTRWGAYGLTHWRDVVVLGEWAAGTDRADLDGGTHNLLAWYAEADYAPRRWVNVRARYDYLVADRSSDLALREESTYRRYALEGELLPVPFAELRWTLRYIDPRASSVADDRQAYLQMHFSY